MIFSVATYAQEPNRNPRPRAKGTREQLNENVESMKIAFITKKLGLTPEEAQLFWPVYNEYTDKLQDVKRKRRADIKDAKHNIEEMSDKDVERSVDNEMAYRQKELDVQKEYHSKFKAVLPIKKVAKLYQAEEQFKRVLLDKLKKDQPPVRSAE
jgi:hypothetical protein